MKCLTKQECSDWLRQHQIVEKPWHRGVKDNLHLFPINSFANSWVALELVKELVDLMGEWEDVLFQVVDCTPWKAGQFELIEAVRRGHGEARELLEAPGHLYKLENKDELIGMFWLTIAFRWSAYLYSLPCTNVIFNWEGEFVDIWNFDPQSSAEVKEMADYINKRAPQA